MKKTLSLLLFLVAVPLWVGESFAAEPLKTQEMEVLGVAADPQSGQPLVLLRGKEDKTRELTMFIGPFEAQSIMAPLQRFHPPRPLTHDLMLSVIGKLKAKVKRVVITDLKENTYYALVHLETGGSEVTLDSRPSDAIALALRAGVPIFAEERAFLRPLREFH
ncbi:MAG: bifunctional nuclease family protein [candidate division NC10 bacterium]|nr:bifunctional nuclease family protein [candidate division NC10 bacterium]